MSEPTMPRSVARACCCEEELFLSHLDTHLDLTWIKKELLKKAGSGLLPKGALFLFTWILVLCHLFESARTLHMLHMAYDLASIAPAHLQQGRKGC